MAAQNRTTVDLIAIGSRIKKLRGETSQDEFAQALFISQGHLSKIERGKIAPSFEVLFLLADRFRKNIDWILRGEAK